MNTFLSKVDAERRVLTVVNCACRKRDQLAGLSSAAIRSWAMAMGLSRESQVLSVLKQLGDLCQTLSNRSHEHFDKLPTKTYALIEENLVHLKQALQVDVVSNR